MFDSLHQHFTPSINISNIPPQYSHHEEIAHLALEHIESFFTSLFSTPTTFLPSNLPQTTATASDFFTELIEQILGQCVNSSNQIDTFAKSIFFSIFSSEIPSLLSKFLSHALSTIQCSIQTPAVQNSLNPTPTHVDLWSLNTTTQLLNTSAQEIINPHNKTSIHDCVDSFISVLSTFHDSLLLLSTPDIPQCSTTTSTPETSYQSQTYQNLIHNAFFDLLSTNHTTLLSTFFLTIPNAIYSRLLTSMSSQPSTLINNNITSPHLPSTSSPSNPTPTLHLTDLQSILFSALTITNLPSLPFSQALSIAFSSRIKSTQSQFATKPTRFTRDPQHTHSGGMIEQQDKTGLCSVSTTTFPSSQFRSPTRYFNHTSFNLPKMFSNLIQHTVSREIQLFIHFTSLTHNWYNNSLSRALTYAESHLVPLLLLANNFKHPNFHSLNNHISYPNFNNVLSTAPSSYTSIFQNFHHQTHKQIQCYAQLTTFYSTLINSLITTHHSTLSTSLQHFPLSAQAFTDLAVLHRCFKTPFSQQIMPNLALLSHPRTNLSENNSNTQLPQYFRQIYVSNLIQLYNTIVSKKISTHDQFSEYLSHQFEFNPIQPSSTRHFGNSPHSQALAPFQHPIFYHHIPSPTSDTPQNDKSSATNIVTENHYYATLISAFTKLFQKISTPLYSTAKLLHKFIDTIRLSLLLDPHGEILANVSSIIQNHARSNKETFTTHISRTLRGQLYPNLSLLLLPFMSPYITKHLVGVVKLPLKQLNLVEASLLSAFAPTSLLSQRKQHVSHSATDIRGGTSGDNQFGLDFHHFAASSNSASIFDSLTRFADELGAAHNLHQDNSHFDSPNLHRATSSSKFLSNEATFTFTPQLSQISSQTNNLLVNDIILFRSMIEHTTAFLHTLETSHLTFFNPNTLYLASASSTPFDTASTPATMNAEGLKEHLQHSLALSCSASSSSVALFNPNRPASSISPLDRPGLQTTMDSSPPQQLTLTQTPLLASTHSLTNAQTLHHQLASTHATTTYAQAKLLHINDPTQISPDTVVSLPSLFLDVQNSTNLTETVSSNPRTQNNQNNHNLASNVIFDALIHHDSTSDVDVEGGLEPIDSTQWNPIYTHSLFSKLFATASLRIDSTPEESNFNYSLLINPVTSTPALPNQPMNSMNGSSQAISSQFDFFTLFLNALSPSKQYNWNTLLSQFATSLAHYTLSTPTLSSDFHNILCTSLSTRFSKHSLQTFLVLQNDLFHSLSFTLAHIPKIKKYTHAKRRNKLGQNLSPLDNELPPTAQSDPTLSSAQFSVIICSGAMWPRGWQHMGLFCSSQYLLKHTTLPVEPQSTPPSHSQYHLAPSNSIYSTWVKVQNPLLRVQSGVPLPHLSNHDGFTPHITSSVPPPQPHHQTSPLRFDEYLFDESLLSRNAFDRDTLKITPTNYNALLQSSPKFYHFLAQKCNPTMLYRYLIPDHPGNEALKLGQTESTTAMQDNDEDDTFYKRIPPTVHLPIQLRHFLDQVHHVSNRIYSDRFLTLFEHLGVVQVEVELKRTLPSNGQMDQRIECLTKQFLCSPTSYSVLVCFAEYDSEGLNGLQHYPAADQETSNLAAKLDFLTTNYTTNQITPFNPHHLSTWPDSSEYPFLTLSNQNRSIYTQFSTYPKLSVQDVADIVHITPLRARTILNYWVSQGCLVALSCDFFTSADAIV